MAAKNKKMTMKLHAVEGNTQRLDGGAMFGNCPKALWQRWFEPDDKNRIPLACRALLVEIDNKRILFDTGIGAFFEPKLKERYGVVEEEHILLKNLKAMGIREEDIDTIVLSHLHFDHAGGLLSPYDGKDPRLLFPNATIYTSREHWDRAQKPLLRERISFLPHLHKLLEDSGRLVLLDETSPSPFGDTITFSFVHGHTIGLMLARFELEEGPLLFVADLVPGLPWMHLPITMGYDRFPELLVTEKQQALQDLLEPHGRVFFTHDPFHPCATVCRDEKGKFIGEPAPL